MPTERPSHAPALLIAPIIAAAIGGGLYALLMSALAMPLELTAATAPYVMIVHLLLILPAAWLIGLPWHLHLQRKRKTNAGRYWMAGGLVGAIAGVTLYFFVTGAGTRMLSLYPADYPADSSVSPGPLALSDLLGAAASFGAYGALMGALTALIAWLIRRPDRDTITNPPTSPP